jgi:hypothetical protein
MQTIKTVAGAYIGIGALLLGTQVMLANTGDPSCIGSTRHTLIERTFPPRTQLDELQATLKGEKRRSSLLAVSRHVAGWLPDLYTHVVAGPMTLGAFVHGGETCEQAVPPDTSVATPQPVCGPDCQERVRRMMPLR